MKRITACFLALCLFLVSFSLTACNKNMTYDKELDRMMWNGVAYAQYATIHVWAGEKLIDVEPGKQIGIVEGDISTRLFEIKGYPTDEWLIVYDMDIMNSVYIIYKAENVVDIPPDIALNEK